MADLGRLLKPAALARIALLYLVLMGLYAYDTRAQDSGWVSWALVTLGMTAAILGATVLVIFALVVAGRGGWRAWQAGRQRDAGQTADALEGYNRVLRGHPDRAEALVGRAELLTARGDTRQALADLNRAIQVTPHVINFPDPLLYRAYLERGRLREGHGDLAGAVGDWTEASRAAPGAPDPHILRGRAALERGDSLQGRGELTAGVNLISRALQRVADGNQRGALLNMRGLAYNLLGEHRRALADLEQALQLEPAAWVTHYNLGATYVNLGYPEQALAELRAALDLNPPAVRAALRTSRAYAPVRDDPSFQALIGPSGAEF